MSGEAKILFYEKLTMEQKQILEVKYFRCEIHSKK